MFVSVRNKKLDDLTHRELVQVEEFIHSILCINRPIDVFYDVTIVDGLFRIECHREVERTNHVIRINIPTEMRQRNAGKVYRVSDSLEIEFSQT
jgi:hypothetical protein